MVSEKTSARVQQTFVHGLPLGGYLDDLIEIRNQSDIDLCLAAERSLKTLDRFLSDLAVSLGMPHNLPSMGDSIRFLEQMGGLAQAIGVRAERFRNTRNALAHNPDLTLRPDAAVRILDGVEKIIRLAAGSAYDMSRRPPITVPLSALVTEARAMLLQHGVRQIVVVNQRNKLIDLITYRDIVVVESILDIDGDGDSTRVEEAISTRDERAAAPVGRSRTYRDVVEALHDERISAAVVTENGKFGEAPLGVITRGDILRLR